MQQNRALQKYKVVQKDCYSVVFGKKKSDKNNPASSTANIGIAALAATSI
jgi:hypothetical protein